MMYKNSFKAKKHSSLKKHFKKSSKNENKDLLITLFNTLKQPLILGMFILLFAILIVPTVIVRLAAAEQTQTVPAQVIDEQAEFIQDEPSLHVSVERTHTNKIEDVPLETYVARVVASEMPAEFEIEALKAQSIAARTYVIHYMLQQADDESVSITDKVQHQVYKNDAELREQWGKDYQLKMDKIMQAVHATKGEVLTYENELITPVYFSTSNGYTENSEEYWQTEIPYLRSVASPWDEQSPKYKEQVTFSVPDLASLLNINLQPGVIHNLEMTKTTGQRVKHLLINGTSFTGREVREKLNLPSSDFSIEQKGDYFIFTTRGYGHGVGMSQYGADGMAKEGKTYEEIIEHYYQGVKIAQLSDLQQTRLSAWKTE